MKTAKSIRLGLFPREKGRLSFSECLCTKYQSKNDIVRNNAILEYCDRVIYNRKRFLGKINL